MPSLKGFNLLIHLDIEKCVNYRQSLLFDARNLLETRPKFKNLMGAKDEESRMLMDINPVACLLKDLEVTLSKSDFN